MNASATITIDIISADVVDKFVTVPTTTHSTDGRLIDDAGTPCRRSAKIIIRMKGNHERVQ